MAKEVEAKVSGSGDMEISVTERLTARVSGSGDINTKENLQLKISILIFRQDNNLRIRL